MATYKDPDLISRDYDHREDGEPYVSPIRDHTRCPCGATIYQHSEGRPRRYCSRTCRSRAHRAVPKIPGL